jgi:hypothetical protein
MNKNVGRSGIIKGLSVMDKIGLCKNNHIVNCHKCGKPILYNPLLQSRLRSDIHVNLCHGCRKEEGMHTEKEQMARFANDYPDFWEALTSMLDFIFNGASIDKLWTRYAIYTFITGALFENNECKMKELLTDEEQMRALFLMLATTQ